MGARLPSERSDGKIFGRVPSAAFSLTLTYRPRRRPSAVAMLCLQNCLLPQLHAASPLPSPISPHVYRLLSTSTSASAFPVPFSFEDYLIASCGLALAQEEISRTCSISASNSDAIIALLSDAGLSCADVTAVVSADPLLLRAKVDNIAPHLLALRNRVGLSAPQIARFLLVASRPLRKGDVVARLEFFISFYGSFEQVLVAASRNQSLLKASLERLIEPNIALLRQWGVPDIAQLCSNSPWVLTFNPERVKEFLLRAKEIGVPPTSRMFKHTVSVVSGMFKEKQASKLEFIKRTLGCSESEASIAVCKMPGILGISDEILLHKIEFLVNEAAMAEFFVF
ncbi:uncharacterized protein [Miscanthus floridulus]|uniref:uncharacterized protein n=1 Tax=Miscanthus floridulus TaxID=154761 RepID=UPI0034587C0C